MSWAEDMQARFWAAHNIRVIEPVGAVVIDSDDHYSAYTGPIDRLRWVSGGYDGVGEATAAVLRAVAA